MPAPIDKLPGEIERSAFREEVVNHFTKKKFSKNKGPKVFGIGLSRTGTTSLSSALSILGYKSGHWKKNGRILSWPEFYVLDAATDISCSARFESLYYTFENSKFIYTVRDIGSWKKSIKNHYNADTPKEMWRKSSENSFWSGNHKWNWYNKVQKIQARKNLYANHSSWKDAYVKFDERVKQFFKNKRDDRMIKINIIGGDGFSKICPFLDKSVPEEEFPHLNKSQNE
jgi:hypothetical protein